MSQPEENNNESIISNELLKPGRPTKKYGGSFAYNTKFNPKWTELYQCIGEDIHSNFHFRCLVCDRSLSCKHQGLTDVRRHLETKSHLSRLKITSEFSAVVLTQPPNPMAQDDPHDVIPELCKHFYRQGAMTGSGGAISVRSGDTFYVTPSGIEKETVTGNDLFGLDMQGNVISCPDVSRNLKCSSCLPNFLCLYQMKDVGAIYHLHSKCAVLTSMLSPGDYFTLSDCHMIKRLRNDVTGQFLSIKDVLSVPIVTNHDSESDIKDELAVAIKNHPEVCVVLIRGHGYYIWGKDWRDVKLMSEAFEYLCDIANSFMLHRISI